MWRESFKVAGCSVLSKACYYQCDFKMEFDDRSFVVTCLYMYPNSLRAPKKKNYFIHVKERRGREFT